MKSPIKFYNNIERSSSVYRKCVSVDGDDWRKKFNNEFEKKKNEVKHTNEPLSIYFPFDFPIQFWFRYLIV